MVVVRLCLCHLITLYSMIATTKAFVPPCPVLLLKRVAIVSQQQQLHHRPTSSSSPSLSVSPHLLSLHQQRANFRRWFSAAKSHKVSTPDGTTSQQSALEWETFDYSDTPKWDSRFDESSTRAVIASNQQELEEIIQEETAQDELIAQRLEQYNRALLSLSPELVAHATRVLQPYITPQRLQRMNQVLSQRTMHCRFLFENPANPSNVWACLRTLDSFGIQCVDVIITSGQYQGKAALAQKRGMRTAMGSAQWLTLRNHASTEKAIESLRKEGYKLYASDLNPNSRDIRTMDWDAKTNLNSENNDDRPICIVMGNENNGISEEMRSLVDETFTLPMCGFAESFNLSVATAITLAHLSARSSCVTASEGPKGPIRPGDLKEHDMNCLRLKGILNSIAHKKTSIAILKREGILVPPELGWL